MIELPEAEVLAEQIRAQLVNKKVAVVVVDSSPHKLAWYEEPREHYPNRLEGRTLCSAQAIAHYVKIDLEDVQLLFAEGIQLCFHKPGQKIKKKHQLLVTFSDDSSLSASVQMYGGLWCFKEGEFENPYFSLAKKRPHPYLEEFDLPYFEGLCKEGAGLRVKALLATKQRIPGLGNGVLQDILFYADVHPKAKVKDLSGSKRERLFFAICDTLNKMKDGGGRDTEKNLFGQKGGYTTKLCKNTVGKPCSVCGTPIEKEAFLGGSIYFCSRCQPL